MSRQYLSQHTIDNAHDADIFALAATPTSIISASGSSSIKIYSTLSDEFPIAQVLKDAHPLGVHHLTISRNYQTLVSVGFEGSAKIWRYTSGAWSEAGEIQAAKKAGELWAVCLDTEGRFLVGTTSDGRVNVWEVITGDGNSATAKKFAEWETRGTFGLAVDISPDNKLTATSHPTGNIYVFSTNTTRLLHSLPTQASPVRVLKFSPGSSLLAAAGDSRSIHLYDPASGEEIAMLRGHDAWITSLDWSYTGEYLLSGSLDGKVKVWDVNTRTCVATHTADEAKGLWSVKWLPKGETSGERSKAERFVIAGNGRAIGVYREASGAA